MSAVLISVGFGTGIVMDFNKGQTRRRRAAHKFAAWLAAATMAAGLGAAGGQWHRRGLRRHGSSGSASHASSGASNSPATSMIRRVRRAERLPTSHRRPAHQRRRNHADISGVPVAGSGRRRAQDQSLRGTAAADTGGGAPITRSSTERHRPIPPKTRKTGDNKEITGAHQRGQQQRPTA